VGEEGKEDDSNHQGYETDKRESDRPKARQVLEKKREGGL